MNTDTYNYFSFFKFLFLAILLSAPFILSAETEDWQLNCPFDVEIDLPPGECNAQVDYDTLNWSSTEGLIDTVFFPGSGNFFGIGTATVTLAVTTESNQLEVCEFKIIVKEFQPATLDCIQNLHVSLEGDCERDLLPSEILRVDSAGCLSNYNAARIGPNGVDFPVITSLDIGTPFTAVVQHQTNMTQCSTQVTVTGGVPPSITCPPDITVACNITLTPLFTGNPDTIGCFENLDLTYTDETAQSFCLDTISFQTTRTWVAIDPLGNEDVCEQIITGVRGDLSTVEFPPNFNGSEQMKLNCSDTLTLTQLTDPVFLGVPTLGGFSVNQVTLCDVAANYNDIITNRCGESNEIMRIWSVVNTCDVTDFVRDTQYIEVIDESSPIISLPDTIYASLSSYCTDSIFIPAAEIIFECSEMSFEIRTTWDTLYTNGGWTKIGVSGANQYPVTYKVTDQCGNFTFFTPVLKIEDATLASCPPNDTIDCDMYFGTIAPALGLQDFETLNELGVPTFHANCSFPFSETDSVSINGCGEGTIIRRLTSDSVATDFCRQVITVAHLSNYSVLFPEDISICEHPDSANLVEPIVSGVSCENISITFSDKFIDLGDEGCYTLERTHRIINTCIFDGTNENDDEQLDTRRLKDGGDGLVEYTQIIIVNERDGPSFPDGCGFPDLPVFQNNCEVTVTVPTPTVEGCNIIDFEVSGSLGNEMGENVNIGFGTYIMNFTAVDECGKIGTCRDTFSVIDNAPPVAVCEQNFTVNLPYVLNPFVNIEASDFDGGSFDNCGQTLSFFILQNDSLVSSINVDCDDFGGYYLELIVEDQSGNMSACSTSLIVLEPAADFCDVGSIVTGEISTDNDIGINNVDVEIEGGPYVTINTDTSGLYYKEMEMGIDVTITPSKNTNHINGVTTYDAVLMTRHILNVDPFTDPYTIIAADINNSGTVTTFDIVEMRKLILFIYSNFPSNSSWRFVRKDYVFPNPNNPWSEPFPESIMINNIYNDMMDLDFIGIKIGDLNGSADPKE